MKHVTLRCPNCLLEAKLSLSASHRLLIYTCPMCKNNILYHKGKADIIPIHLFKKILRRGNLVLCGDVQFKVQSRRAISDEDISDLRILLETETDSSKIISKL
jgi:hypothetical protein